MKKSLRTTIAVLLTFQASLARSEAPVRTVNLTNILALNEALNSDPALKQVGFDLNYPTAQASLKMWKSAMIHKDGDAGKNFLELTARTMRPYIGNDNLITLFSHYMFTGQRLLAGSAIVYYYLNLFGMLGNRLYDPRSVGEEIPQSEHQQLFQTAGKVYTSLRTCVANLPQSPSVNGSYTETQQAIHDLIENCLSKGDASTLMTKIKVLLEPTTPNKGTWMAPMMISPTGYIPGNEIEQLVQSNHSASFLQKFGELTRKFMRLKSSIVGKKYSEMTVDDFAGAMKKGQEDNLLKFFTEEGVSPQSLAVQTGKVATGDSHPALMTLTENGEKNIFGEFFKALDEAKSTIFVDVFFLGGSLGASIARKLVQKAQDGVKVYIINDRRNSLGFAKEMDPVFFYLRGYSQSELGKGKLFISPPFVDQKKTSLPSFVDLLISDKSVHFLTDSKVWDKTVGNPGLYLKGKSDHSKVYIIDGNSDEGVAFVGSKNLTDSSGGIAYDEVTKIKGPAVRVIQDAYYYDLLEAFANDAGSNTTPSFDSYPQIFGVSDKVQFRSLVKTWLKPVDILGRDQANYLQRPIQVPLRAENTTLMIGENTVYGVTRSPVIQDLHGIMGAKKQIIISEQFLYDADIVRGLIQAKMNRPELRIMVLLAPIDHPMDLRGPSPKKLAHIPNILFLRDMMDVGIEIKWKSEPDPQTDVLESLKNSEEAVILSPEYHIKGLSVDGVTEENSELCKNIVPSEEENSAAVAYGSKEHRDAVSALSASMPVPPLLITGSANKDNMTMLGGFREFQVGTYSRLATIRHDCMFWLRWKDPGFSRDVNIDQQFLLTEKFLGLGFSSETLIQLLKEAFIGVYDFNLEYRKSGE